VRVAPAYGAHATVRTVVVGIVTTVTRACIMHEPTRQRSFVDSPERVL